MWKYVDTGNSWIPGVPATDLSDEDFNRYAEAYAAVGGFEPDALAKSGLWVHEPDGKKKPESDGT